MSRANNCSKIPALHFVLKFKARHNFPPPSPDLSINFSLTLFPSHSPHTHTRTFTHTTRTHSHSLFKLSSTRNHPPQFFLIACQWPRLRLRAQLYTKLDRICSTQKKFEKWAKNQKFKKHSPHFLRDGKYVRVHIRCTGTRPNKNWHLKDSCLNNPNVFLLLHCIHSHGITLHKFSVWNELLERRIH